MNTPTDRRHRAVHWLLVLAIAATCMARAVGIGADLRGDDEWRETETATMARHFVLAPNVLWPRINWGAPGPGYVEAEFQLMPWTVHLLYRVFGPQPWLGRALAIALTGVATWLMFRLARCLLPPRAALLAAVSFASAPLVFRYGRAFMPEALVLVFYLLAAERFGRWLARGRWQQIATAGACLGLAILVKPTSVHLGLVAGVLAFARGGVRLLFGRHMLAFGAIALLPAIAYYAHAASLHSSYGNSFGVISGGDSKWGSAAWWFDPSFYRTLQRIDVIYGMGYAGSLLALLAMFAGRPRWLRTASVVWLLVVFVYYLIVARYAGHESRGLHYHIYVVVPLSLATAGGASLCRSWLRARWPGQKALVLGLAALPVLAMWAQQWRANWRFLQLPAEDVFVRAGRALANVSCPGDRVVVTSTDPAIDCGVANNFEEPKVMFYAWRQGRMLARDQLCAANLQAAVTATQARYVVVLDAVGADAAADFVDALAQLDVVASEDGFRVYRTGPQ